MRLRTLPKRLNEARLEGAAAWNRFWFEPADPVLLGVIRILVGSMLVYTHIVWGLDIESFLGPEGWNGAQIVTDYQAGTLAPSFWWWVPAEWNQPVHWLSVSILVFFTLGICTRITSILSMAVLVSYSYRSVLSNYGLDQINAILAFYLCVGPSGAALSVDRLIRNYRTGGRWFTGESPPKLASARLALRLIQVHFCVIYLFAGLSKLQGNAWWNGEAVWMAFANSEYQTVDMTWIAWYPWVSDLMTHTTIVWEVSFAALVWTRLRPLVIAVGAALHIGIGGAMGMWTFGFIMIYGHISFWSPDLAHAVLDWIRQLPRRIRRIVFHPGHRRAEPAPAGTRTPAPVGSRSVLCIEADGRSHRQCVEYFRKNGLRCFTASNVIDAIEIGQAEVPDAIIVSGRGFSGSSLTGIYENCPASDEQLMLFVLSQSKRADLQELQESPQVRILVGNTKLGVIRRIIQKHFATRSLVPATVGGAETEIGSAEWDASSTTRKPR